MEPSGGHLYRVIPAGEWSISGVQVPFFTEMNTRFGASYGEGLVFPDKHNFCGESPFISDLVLLQYLGDRHKFSTVLQGDS